MREPRFQKSSYSCSQGCVEVAFYLNNTILIRDTKHQSGQMLRFASLKWSAFLLGVKKAEFDRPQE